MKNLISLCLSFVLLGLTQAQTAESVLNQMLSALDAGKTYEYTMVQEERIDGKIHKNKIFTKIQETPKKVFIDNVEGANEGVQVLYVSGERDNKALVNKMFGIKLSPFNGLIRKNQERNLMSDLRVKRKTDTPDATPAEGAEGAASVADDAVPMTEE